METFDCVNCESGEEAVWGVNIGESYAWRFMNGTTNWYQRRMDIVDINITYMTEEQRTPWGGWSLPPSRRARPWRG